MAVTQQKEMLTHFSGSFVYMPGNLGHLHCRRQRINRFTIQFKAYNRNTVTVSTLEAVLTAKCESIEAGAIYVRHGTSHPIYSYKVYNLQHLHPLTQTLQALFS